MAADEDGQEEGVLAGISTSIHPGPHRPYADLDLYLIIPCPLP